MPQSKRGIPPPSGVYPIFRNCRLFIGHNIIGAQAWFGLMSDGEVREAGPELKWEWFEVYTAPTGPEVFPEGVMGISAVHEAFTDSDEPHNTKKFKEQGLEYRMRKCLEVPQSINTGRYGYQEVDGGSILQLSKPFIPPASKKRQRSRADEGAKIEKSDTCKCGTSWQGHGCTYCENQDDPEDMPPIKSEPVDDVQGQSQIAPTTQQIALQGLPNAASSRLPTGVIAAGGSVPLRETDTTQRQPPVPADAVRTAAATLKANVMDFCQLYGALTSDLGQRLAQPYFIIAGNNADASVFISAAREALGIMDHYLNDLRTLVAAQQEVRTHIQSSGVPESVDSSIRRAIEEIERHAEEVAFGVNALTVEVARFEDLIGTVQRDEVHVR